VLSQSNTFEWHSRFKNGRTSNDDDPHTGRPSTARTNETVDRVNAVISGNRRLMIGQIADELNLSFGTYQGLTNGLPEPGFCTTTMRHAARPECQGILGQAQHPRGSPPALITRFGPLRLLPLPQAEDHPEGETISRRRGDTTKYDTAAAGHSQTSLPDMH
jgi:hypothetical protein